MSAPLQGLALAMPQLSGISTLPLNALVACSVSGYAALLAMSWCTPKHLLSLEGKRQHVERINSTLHAVLATTFGLAIISKIPPTCNTRLPSGEDEPFAWLIRAALINTIGYLLVDLGSILYIEYYRHWRARDHAILAHHSFVALCFYVGVKYDMVLWYASVLLVNEASVLPLNALMMLRFYKMTDTFKYMVSGFLTVVVYFFCRIVVLPVGLWAFYRHGFCAEEQGVVVAGFATFNYVFLIGLNFWWFKKLLRGALKTIGLISDTKQTPLLPEERQATRN
jgi:hypothetical protein